VTQRNFDADMTEDAIAALGRRHPDAPTTENRRA
jgi:hypothetical protein